MNSNFSIYYDILKYVNVIYMLRSEGNAVKIDNRQLKSVAEETNSCESHYLLLAEQNNGQ